MTDTQDFEALRLRYLAVGEENDILRYQLQGAEQREAGARNRLLAALKAGWWTGNETDEEFADRLYPVEP